MKKQKLRKLSRAQHTRRLQNSVCPRCGNHTLVHIVRMKSSDVPGKGPTFCGAFWACGVPKGHECYYLSGDIATYLYETVAGTSPIGGPTPGFFVQKVIRRCKLPDP